MFFHENDKFLVNEAKLKILLIDPPFHRIMGFYRYFFPFGLASLSSYLKKKGHEVVIYDADHGKTPIPRTSTELLEIFPKYLEGIKNPNHEIWQEVEETIATIKPDLIGVSFLSTKLGSVIQTVNIAKKIYPKIPVVLGGAHPSFFYEVSLNQTRADFIILGEGEETFAELISCLEKKENNFHQIAGLAFKGNQGNITCTAPRALLKNIDQLPFPDRDSLLKQHTYRPDDLGMMMTSRGCPFNCTFCASIWGRNVRYRSVENIIKEIEWLHNNYNVQKIYFKDDTFTLDKSRIYEFCISLQQRNIKIKWECLTRIELIDEELIQKMREAGMDYLKIGIETGSERLLKKTNKNITIAQIRKGAEILRATKQDWSAFFMIGYPDETEEEIFMTWNLIEEIKPTYVSMSILVPYPGSQYYYELEELGWISQNSNWNLYDPFSLETHFTLKIPRKRWQELARKTMEFVDDYNQRRQKEKKNNEK